VNARATDASVCASLPPTIGRRKRLAARTARALTASDIMPLRASTSGSSERARRRSAVWRRPVSAEKGWFTQAGMRSSARYAKSASASARLRTICSCCASPMSKTPTCSWRPPGKRAAHLLAHEHVGPVRELQGAGDRVVVGQGEEVHARAARLLVDRLRLLVRLVGHARERPHVDRTRARRMDVQVAAQASGLPDRRHRASRPHADLELHRHWKRPALREREARANIP
jgi:hypothetical protein